MCKRYRNVGMSVEDRILNGICDGCDQDMAKCYNQDYCEYDKEEVKDVHQSEGHQSQMGTDKYR